MKKTIIDEEEFDKLHKLTQGGYDDLLVFVECLRAYTSNKNKIPLCFLIRECYKNHTYLEVNKLIKGYRYLGRFRKNSMDAIYNMIKDEYDFDQFTLYCNKVYMKDLQKILCINNIEFQCTVKKPKFNE